jgi:hypothetical protein
LTEVVVVDLVPKGQQCVLRVDEKTTYVGDLDGTSEMPRPAEIRFFATCDEVSATGGAGIPSTFNGVEHFVGADGSEATIRQVGATDSTGNYRGLATVHGDLNGVLQVAASPASYPTGNYHGILVVTG